MRISDLGEDLGQIVGLVDADHFLVEWEFFTDAMDVVDLLVRIVVVFFVVDDAVEWESFGLLGLFVGVADAEGYDGDDALGEVE